MKCNVLRTHRNYSWTTQRAVAERVVAKAALTASLQGGEEHDQQVAVSWAAEADRKLGEAEAVSRHNTADIWMRP